MSARNTVKSIQDIMRQDVGVDGDAQRLSQLCWMFFLKIIDDQDQQLEIMQDNYRSPIPEALQWRTWATDPEGITGDTLLTFINTELFPSLKELPTTGKNANRSRVVRSVFEDAYNYMKSGQLLRQVINKISGVDFNDLSERKHFGDIYEQLLNDLQSAGNSGEYYTPRAVTAFMVDRIDPKPGEILFDPSCGTGGFLTCSIRHMRDRYVKKVEDEQAMQASLRAVEKKQLPHMLCVTNMLLHGIEDPSFVRHDNTLARPYISYGQSDRVDIILTNPPFGGKEEDGIDSNFPPHFRTKETADLFLALFIRLLKPGGRAAIVLPDGSLFGEGVKTRLKEHLLEECNLHTIVRLPNSVFKPYASIGTNLLFFEKGEPTQDIWFYEHRVPEGQKAYSMTRPIKIDHLQGCVEWWGGVERQDRQQTEVAWKVSLDEIKTRNYNLDFKNPHSVTDDHGNPAEMLAKLGQDEQNTASLRDQLKAILAKALPRMNAGHLLQHFERLSEVPDAIPRLRRFILDLAVRGKLVEQDLNDEPAAELLKRIQAEKAELVTQGKLKKSVLTLYNDSIEPPFGLPATWSWVCLGDVAQYGIPDKVNSNREIEPETWVLDLEDIEKDTSRVINRVISSARPFRSTKTVFKQGDVLFGKLRPYLNKVVVVNIDGVCSTEIVPIRGYCGIVPEYTKLVLMSPLTMRRVDRLMYGMKMPRLGTNDAISLEFPLPPLAEQHRIVAKVNELMALYDQLEAQRVTIEAESRRLLEAVLHEALTPAQEEVA